MDPMQLAQMKRTTAWHAEQVRRIETNLRSAELAVEGAKKKAEDLKKKLIESKHTFELHNQDVIRGEEEVRRKIADDRQQSRE